MASTFKIILAVGGIFIAGAVTGGFVSLRVAERLAREKRDQQRMGPNEIGGRLAEQLKLTAGQRVNVRPIIGRTSDELRRVRSESFARTAELVAKMDAEIMQILTEEQRVIFKEIRAREEERRQKWMQERAERAKRNEQRPPAGPADEKSPPPPPPVELPALPPARTP